MSYQDLALRTFFFLLLIFAWALNRPAAADDGLYRPSAYPDRIILTFSGDPATTQAVSWRTEFSAEAGQLELALADASPDFPDDATSYEAEVQHLAVDGVRATYHTVELVDLAPATLYAYRVGDGAAWSEWFHFRTAAAEPAPFSFIYFGDAQNNVRSMWSRVIRQAYSSLPDARFILHAGDLVNKARSDTEWGEWFAAGGWINGSLPSIATPGNHEYDGPRLAPQWRPQFAFPLNGPDVGEKSLETVYYVDYQGVRFISLNSQIMTTLEAAETQASWLRQVLLRNPNRWTIVTHHHPMFAAAEGRTGHLLLNKKLRPVYETFGVDLVLQGHDHTYARGSGERVAGNVQPGSAAGPVYVVSVSGPKMYDPRDPWWAEVSLGYSQVYQLIHVDGDLLRYEAYTATGDLFDSFTLAKDAGGSRRLKDVERR